MTDTSKMSSLCDYGCGYRARFTVGNATTFYAACARHLAHFTTLLIAEFPDESFEIAGYDASDSDLDAVKFYDGRANNYDVALDPRCLWGWGPGTAKGCTCRYGHACFRPLGHPGKCWDVGDKPQRDALRCASSQRPSDWDAHGRTEANR